MDLSGTLTWPTQEKKIFNQKIFIPPKKQFFKQKDFSCLFERSNHLAHTHKKNFYPIFQTKKFSQPPERTNFLLLVLKLAFASCEAVLKKSFYKKQWLFDLLCTKLFKKSLFFCKKLLGGCFFCVLCKTSN